jgi:hypothetical protein
MELAYKYLLISFFIYESYFLLLSSRALSSVAKHIENEPAILWGKLYSKAWQLRINRKFIFGVMNTNKVNEVTNEALRIKLLKLGYLYRMEIIGLNFFIVFFVALVLINYLV